MQDKFNILTNQYSENLNINNLMDRIKKIEQISLSVRNELQYGKEKPTIENFDSVLKNLKDHFNN